MGTNFVYQIDNKDYVILWLIPWMLSKKNANDNENKCDINEDKLIKYDK